MEALEDRCVPTAGVLDTTFGNGGFVATDFTGPTIDFGRAVAVVQADGKIVMAGSSSGVAGYSAFALTRYNTDGSLDASFGSGGKVTTNFAGAGAVGLAVAIQDDGKILAAGGSAGLFALARYNANGSLDSTFDGDGMVTTDVSLTVDYALTVAVQADGKIVAGGNGLTLVRYNSDGSLDTTFDGDGVVITGVSTYQQASVAIQSNGKIVAAGGYSGDFTLVRLNSDGSLDTTFDGDGKVTTDFAGNFDQVYSVAVGGDGKIVAAGYRYEPSTGPDFALARYNSDGSLDTNFDGDGKVTTDFGNTYDLARAVAIQDDGKVVAAGFSGNSLALARYNCNGTLDTTFDGDGLVKMPIAGAGAAAYGVVLQSDGKIVAAGTSGLPGTGPDFALARFNSNGSLDTTFDGDGTVTTNLGVGSNHDFGRGGVAVQADGKIVVAGGTQTIRGYDFALARYNSDGTLDSSFGVGGQVTTDFANSSDLAFGVAIQSDGRIVVVGGSANSNNTDFALARYNKDGSLDSTFGQNGKVTTHIGTSDVANSVAIQVDGKIVIAGTTGSDFALARYNSDGTLDANFDGDGVVLTDIGGLADVANDMALQTDGKIVAAGYAVLTGESYSKFALARYNSDGSLDTTFDQDGKVTTDLGGPSSADGVAIQADGKIVAAGTSLQGQTGYDFAVTRYNCDGSLDTNFGRKGKVTTDFGSYDDQAFAMVLQTDGKIVVAGETYQALTTYDFALARYTSDGSLDKGFGDSGKVITDFADFQEQAVGVALQADGKIVAAGTTFGAGTGFDFAVARYIGVSPSQPIQAIIASVQALIADGVLNNGQGNALLAKLQHAMQHLDSGQVGTAVNDLKAFVNQVRDYIGEEILTSALGQPLIDEADALIHLLT